MLSLRHKAENRTDSWLPCGKGGSREAGEGLTLKRRKASVFRCFSVPLAPFVTLARDTFLPGRQRLKNCAAAEEKCADFAFEVLKISFVFSAAQRKDSHSHRLPPRGSCRGATEGECAAYVFLLFSGLKEGSLTLTDRHTASRNSQTDRNAKHKISFYATDSRI